MIARTPTRPIVFALAFTLAGLVCVPLQAATYYVKSTGSDGASGLSVAAAWRTITRVNQQTFQPGDQILFEGGSTFSGKIYFPPGSGGTEFSPVVLGSYTPGSGAVLADGAPTAERATIDGGAGGAFYAWRAAGMVIANLNFHGSGAASNTSDGLNFYNDLSGNVKLAKLDLRHLEVTGFGKTGIAIGGYNGSSGYRNVRISHVSAHHNLNAGIQLYGANFTPATPNYANEDVQVTYCRAHNNDGDPTLTRNTGNGIVLGSVQDGLIEHCIAFENGINNKPSEGPVGLWAYDADNVIIQFCESYNNRTGSSADGDGFDLDQNTSNCILQYNYSHGNDGAGYLAYAGPGLFNRNNTIRYNISENDCRKLGYGAIMVGGRVDGIDVYGNTVYLASSTQTNDPAAVRLANLGGNPKNVRVRNNVFFTEKTGNNLRLVRVDLPRSDHFFQGNLYHAINGYRVTWGSTTYTSQTAWLAAVTDQERSGATIVAVNADPLLADPGNGGTLGDTSLLATLTAYRIGANSPARDAGIDLVELGISPGSRDYFGGPSRAGPAFDIGAHEYLGGFWAWAFAAGLPADGTGDGAYLAKPAGDGIENLIKFALGLDPLTPGFSGRLAAGLWTDEQAPLSPEYLSLTVTLPEPEGNGVAVGTVTSGDLAGWPAEGVEVLRVSHGNGTQTITWRDTVPLGNQTRRFLRLKASTP